MKKIFLLLLLAIWIIPVSAQEQPTAQNPAAPAANQPAAPPMGEDDRLPFMAERDAAANRSEPSTSGLLVRALGAMALIVGLIFGAGWTLKKFGLLQTSKTSEDSPDLTVMSSVSLGTNRTLSIVKFGERTLLVGSTAQSFTLLAEDGAQNQNFAAQPRSVAELLAANEDISFRAELSEAEMRLESFEMEGRENDA